MIGTSCSTLTSRPGPKSQVDVPESESSKSGGFNLDTIVKSEKDVVQFSQDSFGDTSKHQSSLNGLDTPKMLPQKRKATDIQNGDEEITKGWFTPKQEDLDSMFKRVKHHAQTQKAKTQSLMKSQASYDP